ncbi:dihydrofolate reductase family protein [Streptomyces sp. NPDC006624]|uniref:dihydrofolate reductase family protein n=1 Tax=Streptomyces sp. NPDC006624 TaxID=3154892 RepID=UPI0033A8D061
MDQTVADPEAGPGNDLSIIGSASLIRYLHAAGLVGHDRLLIHPLTLGGGTCLFEGPAPLTEFELTEPAVTTTKGVIVARCSRR